MEHVLIVSEKHCQWETFDKFGYKVQEDTARIILSRLVRISATCSVKNWLLCLECHDISSASLEYFGQVVQQKIIWKNFRLITM